MVRVKNILKSGFLLPASIILSGLALYALWSHFLAVRVASLGACDRAAGCQYLAFNGRRSVTVSGFSADDSRFLSVGTAKGVIHDANTGSRLGGLNPGRDTYRYRISGDRSEILAYRADAVKVLDWEGQLLQSWTPDPESSVRNVALLPVLNGFLVAESGGLAVRHGNGDLVAWLVEGGSFLQVAATPDGAYVAAYDFVDDVVMGWPLQSLGDGIVIPNVEAQTIYLSADGARIAAAGAPGAYVWDTRDGSPVIAIEATDFPVTAAALASDGTRLAVGFENGAVVIFDVATQAQLQQFDHRHAPRSIRFNRSSDRLAVSLNTHTRVSGGEPLFRRSPRQSDRPFRPGDTLRQSDNRIEVTPGYVVVWSLAD